MKNGLAVSSGQHFQCLQCLLSHIHTLYDLQLKPTQNNSIKSLLNLVTYLDNKRSIFTHYLSGKGTYFTVNLQ